MSNSRTAKKAAARDKPAPRAKAPARPPRAKAPGGLAAASAAMGEVALSEVHNVSAAKSKPQSAKPKSREGKKGLVLYVPPEVTLALRKLALEHNSDVQRMGWQALELLFAEYGAALPGSARPS